MIKFNMSLKQKALQTGIQQTLGPKSVNIETVVNTPCDSGNPEGSSFATYIHTQMVASKNWEIEHNLNCYPSVTIVDTGGNVVIGEISYISDEKLLVSFSNIFSGKAYVN